MSEREQDQQEDRQGEAAPEPNDSDAVDAVREDAAADKDTEQDVPVGERRNTLIQDGSEQDPNYVPAIDNGGPEVGGGLPTIAAQVDGIPPEESGVEEPDPATVPDPDVAPRGQGAEPRDAGD